MAVVGVPQTRDGGYPNRAPSPATIMSAHSTRSVPPPMHQPWTAAIVGFWAYQSFMYVSTKRFIIRQSATESQARADRPSADRRPSAAWPATAQSSP